LPWGEGNEGEQIDYGNDPPEAILNYNPDPAAMAFHRSAQGITYDDSRAEKEWR